MIQVLIILFAIYWVLVIYLEYLVSKLYKQLCPKHESGIKIFLIGYRKKINCLRELKENNTEIQKVFAIDRIIKKISFLMIFMVLILIIMEKF